MLLNQSFFRGYPIVDTAFILPVNFTFNSLSDLLLTFLQLAFLILGILVHQECFPNVRDLVIRLPEVVTVLCSAHILAQGLEVLL